MNNAAAFHAASNVIASIGAITAWAILATAVIALLAMAFLTFAAAARPATTALAATHRFEATASHDEDGRFLHVKVVGLDCPLSMRAAIDSFADSVRAKGYLVDHVGAGNEVHVRERFDRLSF
jgi:hypothetical protein